MIWSILIYDIWDVTLILYPQLGRLTTAGVEPKTFEISQFVSLAAICLGMW